MTKGTIEKEIKEGVLTLTFMHPKPQNPFGDHMQNLLIQALEEAESDEKVNSIILTGGYDRSFCVGGDFSELVDMKTGFDEVNFVLGKVIDLYINVLEVTKPIISAVDHYAIGLGFQVAILADYRFATERAKFKMPEVKNGVACTLGGVVLDNLINRHEMMRICYECDTLPIEYCKQVGLINEIVHYDQLLSVAFAKALQYGNYNPVSFRNTKKLNNSRMIRAINEHREGVIQSHYMTFSGNVHKPYMKTILKREE